MFEDLAAGTIGAQKTNQRWTVLVSTIIQVAILGVMILIPLMYPEALPKSMMTTMLVAPPPPPPPPPPPAAAMVKVRPMAKLIQSGKLMTPRAIPKEVHIIHEQDSAPDMGGGVPGGVPGGVAGGQMGGVIGGIIGGVVGTNVPPPPKVTPQRIRQGGNVQQALLVNQVKPLYPPLARTVRVSGTVTLHAIISKDGTVQRLESMSGPPLLVQAALDAVRQWRYRPTLLNGEPVEVDTTIEVVFTLN